MARVGEYQQQVQTRPVNQRDISVQTSPETFGAGVGRAVGGLRDAAFEIADAVQARQELKDEAAGRDATQAYRRAQREYLDNPETGRLVQTGENALDLRRGSDEWFRTAREEHGKGLTGAARRRYDAEVDGLQDQAQQRLVNKEAGETRNYIENGYKSSVEGYLTDAADNYDNPELFQQNLDAALAEQQRLAALQGWDAATLDNARGQTVSGAYKQRILLAAEANPVAAGDMLDAYGENLTPDDRYALETKLKPIIVDAKAREFVGQFVSTTGGIGDPYARLVTGAESGGDSNAKNPLSSATGAHQFLSSTYLGEVRKMQAQGLAPWAEGLTPAGILATRTNTEIEGRVFQFFREGNQAQITAMGFEVTPLNEYVFHHFGDGGGAAVLRLARTNPSAPLEAAFGAGTAGIVKANPYLRGKTVGELYDWAAAHLGVDSLTGGGSSGRFDASAAMQAAMAIEDPDVQEAAMRRIAMLATAQDNIRAADRTEAQEDAWRIYQQTGQTDLPTDMRIRMGLSGWSAFQSATAREVGGETIATDPATWETLTRMRISDPAAFASTNLTAHYGSLSKEDRRFFVTEQETLRAASPGGPDGKDGLNFDAVYKDARPVYEAMVTADLGKSADTAEEKTRAMNFERQMAVWGREFFVREKRQPTAMEIRDQAGVLLLPVAFGKPAPLLGGGTDRWNETGQGRLFDVERRPEGTAARAAVEFDDIPTPDRARIAAQLMQANGGQVPTSDEIVTAYENKLLIDAGLPPLVDMGTVPDDFIAVAREHDPGMTDDEIVERYQAFVQSRGY